MKIYILFLVSIAFVFWNCAATSDDAIRQQEDFINNHPTWINHDFQFEKRNPELNAEEIIDKINAQKKIDAKLDSIILNQSKD